MLVQLDYGVDEGEQVIDSDPFYRGYRRTAVYGPSTGGYLRPALLFALRLLWRRSPFYYGWDDPFWRLRRLRRHPQLHGLQELPRHRHPPQGRQCAAVRRPCQGPLADRRARRAGAEPGRSDVHRLPRPHRRDGQDHRPSPRRALSGYRARLKPVRFRAGSDCAKRKGPAGSLRPGLCQLVTGPLNLVDQPSSWRVSRRMSASSSASLRAQLLDLLDRVDHRRVVAPAEAAADVGQRLGRQLLRQIHRHLARTGDFAGAPRRGHLGLADAVMLGDLGLDFVDRDAPLVGAKHVGEHFLDERRRRSAARSSSHKRRCG